MQYSNLVYNLLPNLFWNIASALPSGGGAVVTRLDVGDPDAIPDITFIARQLTNADGFPAVQVNHLNPFIQDARKFHLTYGLAPITVNSFEDILNHFQPLSATIGHIRFVSHGNDEFLFFPIFNNGLWSYGMHSNYLNTLKESDAKGLRYVITFDPATPSPTLINGTSQIISGMTSFNNAVVTPLGSPISAEVQQFVDLVNDFYQVKNGTIAINNAGAPPNALMTVSQQTIINASLTRIETAVRARITASGSTVTTAQLDAFKTAVLAATPIELEFLGNSFSLAPTVIADVAAAANNENALRTAISGGTGQPLFRDFLGSLVAGLTLFNSNALKLGGTAVLDESAIRANANLESYALACVDLYFIKNGPLFIGGAAVTPAQKTALSNAVTAITDFIRMSILAAVGNTITSGQLNAFRTAIVNLSLPQSAITGGWQTMDQRVFTELAAANTGMQNNFRAKLEHFRDLMQPADASRVDIRGCMVAKTPSFLNVLRDFMGTLPPVTPVKKPKVSAPEWWQSFPLAFSFTPSLTTVAGAIDALVTSGIAAKNISGPDVDTAITLWRGMIDFDPHFDFITGLFATIATKLDFATLAWKTWRVPPATTGIPILRMEALRIDDLLGLNLGDTIERFRVIFEIPAASAPNAAARTKLNSLQPHLLTFKTKSAAVAAGPAPADLPQLAADLTTLVGNITTLYIAPPPASSLPPASNSLTDIQSSVTRIRIHLETILTGELGAFFTAIQGKTAHANAKIRYYYNVGLPLLLQSSSVPTAFVVSIFASVASVAAGTPFAAAALRSWMRIQWKSTEAAKITAMNTRINSLPLTNNTQLGDASQTSRLSEDDPIAAPNSATEFSPTQAYRGHIITRP